MMSSRSSCRLVSISPTAPRSSFTRTASTSSGSRPTTRRPTSTIRSSSRETVRRTLRACCSVRKPRRFRSARC
jgi:hypothetical protein